MAVDIIVVDDEEMISWTLKDSLESDGYNVKTFADGRSFLDYFSKHGADIVFLDVRLPDSNGLDLLLEATRLDPAIIIIIMTAYGDIETAVKAMKRGAHDYLPKPYSLDDVHMRVKKIVQTNLIKSQLQRYQEVLESKFSQIIGENQKMKQLKEYIGMAAKADHTTVLIRGESGTGKELVARQIHFQSSRVDKPFVDVNAAAISPTLLESELFGHEKGAFTDAQKQKKGLFELANNGTLFLDEIGELDPALQIKLLRVLQERKFRRVGGTTDIHFDVRIISATNANLEKAIETGKLRQDLFYRLNVFTINMPPLRERRDDIMLLAKSFLDGFRREFSKENIIGFREDTIKLLENYAYPGNVRELKNIVERATLLELDNTIRPGSLPEELTKGVEGPVITARQRQSAEKPWETPGFNFKNYIDSVEKKLVLDVLKEFDGKKNKAAEVLGLTRFALRHQLKKHGIADD